MNTVPFPRIARLLPVLALLCGCGELSSAWEHPPVVDARLFGPNGEELTPVVPLSPDEPLRVEVRFYGPGGEWIRDLSSRHQMSLFWDPAGFVKMDLLPDEPLVRIVAVTNPCVGPERRVSIGYGHYPHTDERVFGPFPVAVREPAVGSARLFGPDGEELTPDVRLPYDRTFRVEARFYDCARQLIPRLEESYDVQFFWSSHDFAHVEPVPGERFARDVYVLKEPGTRGTMSIGFGKGSYPSAYVFGPFPVTVVP